ncbi:type II toxin-antitoxin system RelE/ParE family toxin [Nocardia rhizosphaerihabitans]|uniref:type II toxin-antitoxin system RelE/ParE family toxin n=1 Tax=Nocardia rhizosphaerihabitans TaxID=1691570 RepID=UPI001E48363A|nr:type II toxin-antitoxin system RelE/ParE family toxin [Nocardia rhizosphaerihabitans]
MKELRWVGGSLDRLRELPPPAQRGLGYGLHRVQTGQAPLDFKPMPTVGAGAFELRFRDRTGAYRMFYVARFGDARRFVSRPGPVPRSGSGCTKGIASHDNSATIRRLGSDRRVSRRSRAASCLGRGPGCSARPNR